MIQIKHELFDEPLCNQSLPDKFVISAQHTLEYEHHFNSYDIYIVYMITVDMYITSQLTKKQVVDYDIGDSSYVLYDNYAIEDINMIISANFHKKMFHLLQLSI